MQGVTENDELSLFMPLFGVVCYIAGGGLNCALFWAESTRDHQGLGCALGWGICESSVRQNPRRKTHRTSGVGKRQLNRKKKKQQGL